MISLIGIIIGICWQMRRSSKTAPVAPSQLIYQVDNFKTLCVKYADNEERADTEYKGNVIVFEVWQGEVQRDANGNEYWTWSEPEFPLHARHCGVIRCNARPGRPLIDNSGGGYEHWVIMGTCVGKIGGVVTLRNSVMSAGGGNDW
jgi:hypothetical protein